MAIQGRHRSKVGLISVPPEVYRGLVIARRFSWIMGFQKYFIDLFVCFRERRRGGKKRNAMWEKRGLVASHMCPNWGPGPQPRHVP